MDSSHAFPVLDPDELAILSLHGREETCTDGDVLLRAGQRDIDFIVVLDGAVDIRNPTDDDHLVVTHRAGEFVGDIDLLTRRPFIVRAIARGTTRILRMSGETLRILLTTVPRISEKLLLAFQLRRALLQEAGVLGIKVVGPGSCRDTNVVREFLHKNFMPFTWYDSDRPAGQAMLERFGSPRVTPVIECNDGRVLLNPTLRELAKCAGIWEECPAMPFDLAVIGSGPAGMTAAVYAASEGLKTIVLDRCGPGGQAAASSRIENFIGFPAGLSGADLAQRGVLQMLKFGAHIVAPIDVTSIAFATSPHEPHVLHLDCGSRLSAFAVLLATGASWRRLDVPNAGRFFQSGVYYACTSVEADLHKGSDVAVIGAGNSAGQAAVFLSERCAGTVHLIVRGRDLGANMSEYLAARIRHADNVRVHLQTEVREVHGGAHIEAVTVGSGGGGPEARLPVGAVFVFIGAEPYAGWLPPSVARDRLGYVLTGLDVVNAGAWPDIDREPCPLETSIPRLLAAGDVRAGSTKRVGFAVGDGSLAVACVHKLRAGIPGVAASEPQPR